MFGKRKGVFLVFDGTDGSGKTTQLTLLARRLRRLGYSIAIEDFPQYSNPLGQLVRRMLQGEFGPFHKVHLHLASLPYAFDRWLAAPRIRKRLTAGQVVLANRYTSANLIHQGAKLTGRQARRAFATWLKRLEFAVLQLPKPNRVLFLDMPPAVAARLLRFRVRSDRADRDRQHQRAAYQQARRLCRTEPSWVRIPCAIGGQPLPPATIAERVWKFVAPVLRH